jgi:hypothetical protein
MTLNSQQCEEIIHDFSFADVLLWQKEARHNMTDTHLNMTFFDWITYQSPGGVSFGILSLLIKWADDRAANFFSKKHGMQRHMLLKVTFLDSIVDSIPKLTI